MIEDDEVDVMRTSGLLKEFGEITVAANGAEALELLHKFEYDFVVIDYFLPDLDTENIINSNKNSTFVVVTGQGDELLAKEMMKLSSVVDYIPKDKIDLLKDVASSLVEEIEKKREVHKEIKEIEEKARKMIGDYEN